MVKRAVGQKTWGSAMNQTTMPNASWEKEVQVLKRLLRLKHHKYFKVHLNDKRNDMGYPVKEKDGSCVRGLYYAFKIMAIVAVLIIGGCLIAKKAHSAQTASWYGTTGDTCDPWKHTTTANGERFNENAMTAASWKYPLGSKVKVTNLRNHKSVIVRINDRGPGKRLYRKGRVIDLTRGSFAKLAALRDGVIPIKTELLLGVRP